METWPTFLQPAPNFRHRVSANFSGARNGHKSVLQKPPNWSNKNGRPGGEGATGPQWFMTLSHSWDLSMAPSRLKLSLTFGWALKWDVAASLSPDGRSINNTWRYRTIEVSSLQIRCSKKKKKTIPLSCSYWENNARHFKARPEPEALPRSSAPVLMLGKLHAPSKSEGGKGKRQRDRKIESLTNGETEGKKKEKKRKKEKNGGNGFDYRLFLR